MHLIWATDIHLSHANEWAIDTFLNAIKTSKSKVVILGGDISVAKMIVEHLEFMAKELPNKQIYFVLGNHDYYGPWPMKTTANIVAETADETSNLHYLDRGGPVKLSKETTLIGSGLWCDWRAGNWKTSPVWLNDYHAIPDLNKARMGYEPNISRWAMPEIHALDLAVELREIAQKHTDQLEKDLIKAIDAGCKKVIVLTHVPPFWEASFYNGKVQDGDWAPHFVCQVAGDMLKKHMEKHKDIEMLVLTGHTHGSGEGNILPNLKVINGGAKYRAPEIQKPILYK